MFSCRWGAAGRRAGGTGPRRSTTSTITSTPTTSGREQEHVQIARCRSACSVSGGASSDAARHRSTPGLARRSSALGRLVRRRSPSPSCVAAAGVAHDRAGPLGAIRARPCCKRPADAPRHEVDDRRRDQRAHLQDGRDVADRDVERVGDDVLGAAEEQHGDERDRRGAGRRAVGRVAWPVEQVVLAVVLREAALDPRHQEQPGEDHAGDEHAEYTRLLIMKPPTRVSHGGNRRSDPSRKPMYQSGCEYDVAAAGVVRARTARSR